MPSESESGIQIVPTRKIIQATRKVRRRPNTSLTRPARGITATNAIR
jgi:hypothetical protein